MKILVDTLDVADCRAALEVMLYRHPELNAQASMQKSAAPAVEAPEITVEVEAPAVTVSVAEPAGLSPDDPRVGVELDSRGCPWIDGVHATTKSKKKDGTWTKKRGADDAEVEAAEQAAIAEYRARAVPDVTDVPAEGPTTAAPPDGNTPSLFPASPSGFPAPTATPAPVVPISYADLLSRFTALFNAGKMTNEQLFQIFADCGTNEQHLQSDQAARDAVAARFAQIEAAG